MSAAAERIDRALRLVRATLGTTHETTARASLADAIANAKEETMVTRAVLRCDHAGCEQQIVGVGRGTTYDQSIRSARRMAVVAAEVRCWYVSPHGQTLDLCQAHRIARDIVARGAR